MKTQHDERKEYLTHFYNEIYSEGTQPFFDTKCDWRVLAGVCVAIVVCGIIYLVAV